MIKPISSALAHEMGHAYANAKDPAKSRLLGTPKNCQDPKNRNNFSTQTAKDWQDRYEQKVNR